VAKSWLSAILPAAVELIAPGIGSSIGSTVGNLTGLSSTLGQTGTNMLGGALLGGGLGALTGGSKGALYGALSGGITPLATSALGLNSSGILGGGLFGGSGSDVISGGSGTDVLNNTAGNTDTSSSGSGGLFGLGGGSTSSALKTIAPLALMGMALAQGTKKKTANTGPGVATDQNQSTRLSQVEFNPTQRSYAGFDPKTYGYGAQRTFFDNNMPGKATGQPAFAKGGLNRAEAGNPATSRTRGGLSDLAMSMAAPRAQGYLRGPGSGMSDDIPARLSDGEYVMDAHTVAMLGDGSPDEGARRLDAFRTNLRKHKGQAMAKGKLPPRAKRPEAYLAGGRA
jgi:hypothetical protein